MELICTGQCTVYTKLFEEQRLMAGNLSHDGSLLEEDSVAADMLAITIALALLSGIVIIYAASSLAHLIIIICISFITIALALSSGISIIYATSSPMLLLFSCLLLSYISSHVCNLFMPLSHHMHGPWIVFDAFSPRQVCMLHLWKNL